MTTEAPRAPSSIIALAATTGLAALTLYLMVVGESIFLPLVLAIFISYLILATGHAIQRIKVGAWRPSQGLGLTLSIIAFIIVIGLVVQIIAGNVRAVVDAAPQYQERLQALLTQITAFIAGVVGQDKPLTLTSVLEQVDLRAVVGRFAGAFQAIASNTFQIFAYVAFLLLESRYFDGKVKAIFPEADREQAVRATLSQIGSRIETYVLVKTLISMLVGLASLIVLTIAGVDFAPFWSLLIFVLNFIPYIGSPMGMMFPTVLALLQFGDLTKAAVILACLWGVQSAVENLLEPRLMGRSLNLSPVFMILALSVWGAIWGITGMILAVPIMVMLMIVFAQFPTTRPLAVMMSETGEVK
ncbi:MAG: AI-2E family transporter [Rhodospirillaceae bacterium]|nr:AI-2E family transporter [Rhodospirillaceae bacterium]